MDPAGQIACVFVCSVGGIYAFWLIFHCIRGIRPLEVPARSTRGSKQKIRSAQVDWVLQLVVAVVFVVVAGIMVTSAARQHLPGLAQSGASEPEAVRSVQVPGMQPLPPGRLEYDCQQPERPIIGADLCDLPITDADIVALVRHGREIEFLNLNGTEISDETIPQLKQLHRLTDLTLAHTRITDAGFEQLADLANLETLSLAGTGITDDSLQHLGKLTNLRSLHLHHTSVTDAGLKSLESLKRLEYLGCTRAQITDCGIQQLASKLPLLAESLCEDEEDDE